MSSTASRRPGLVFILLTLGIDALGFGIVVPIVPGLVQQLSGGNSSRAAEWVGALVATFSLAQFIAAPILGGLSDRYGRRPIVILSMLGVAANYLLLAWAPSLAWLFLGRLLAGATSANYSTATAYVADITPPAQRSARFGLVGATFGAGFVIGPALGGLLGTIGLRLPFLVAAALALADAGFGALVMPESLPPERRRPFSWRRANPVGSLHTLLSGRQSSWLTASWALLWFGFGALQSTFVLSMGLRFGWGPQENGLALACFGVGQALVQGLLVRPAIRRLGERGAAYAGLAIGTLSYLVFGVAPAGWVIYLAITMQAFGAIATPALRGLLSGNVAAERQGEVQGGLSSVQGLVAVAAPVLAALVYSGAVRLGGPLLGGAPFVLGGLTCGAALLALAASGARTVAEQPG